MADIYMDVDTALGEVPINIMPLLDDSDFKSIEAAVVYNAAGLALFWNFVTTAGAQTCTAVTPTSSGDYDWTDQGTSGMYAIEMPASGGASANNDTEGFGWFTGVATGVLPWRGPVICFRAAALNNSLIDAGTTGLLGPTTAARTLDVSVGGEAGIDWANVGSPTTALNLSATNIDVDQIVASVSGAVGSVTGAVGSVTGLTAATVMSDLDDIQARLPAALTAGGNIKADVLAISGDTTAADNLEAACDGNTYNVGGGAVVAASVTGAVGSVTGAVGSVTGNVGGNVVGTVGSVVGAVGSVTGAVGSVTGNLGGNVLGTLTTTERNAIADANLDRADAIETGLTPRQAHRLEAAAAAAKLSGAATATVTIRNAVADSKDRIVATVDADGNRTAVTTDVTT